MHAELVLELNHLPSITPATSRFQDHLAATAAAARFSSSQNARGVLTREPPAGVAGVLTVRVPFAALAVRRPQQQQCGPHPSQP